MEEKVIYVIPRVVTSEDVTNDEFSVVITDQRTIFVTAKSHQGLFAAWLLGGFLLAALTDAAAKRRYLDDNSVDPETLSRLVDSRVFWHSSLKEAGISKKTTGYYLELRSKDSSYGSKMISARLAPPREYMKHCKMMGLRRREAIKRYASDARLAYEEALPLGIARSSTRGV